jgi:peptidyl-prolyl cis-trans isomerase SurA
VTSISRARRATATAGVLVGALAGGLLSGCGVADDGGQPGVAAEVGDTTITLDEVDDAAEELCELRGDDPATRGTPVSGAEVRTRALQTLVLRAIADGIADDRDIVPSPSYANIEAEADEQGTVQAREVVGLSYFVNVMQAAGREEAGPTASEQEQLAAGITIAQEWTEREGVTTNPVFPDLSIGDVSVEFARDDDLSVAVSDFAESALADADRLSQQEGDSAYAATLPESQRCG